MFDDEIWDVYIGDKNSALLPTDGGEEYDEELWLAMRRNMLEKQVDEIKRENAKLTTAKVFQLIPNNEIAHLRRLMKVPLDEETFLSTMLVAIKHENVCYTDKELSTCLSEIFNAIDVNANGTIDWDELTHYIVHLYEERSGSQGLQQSWEELYRCSTPAERCKKRKIYYFPGPDKIFLLDSCHQSVEDHGKITIFKPQTGTQTQILKQYATVRNDYAFESAEWIPSLNQLAVSTVNNLIKWYAITETKDTDSSDRVCFIKHNYTDGMQLCMKYDSESNMLFTGNNKGSVFGIIPDEAPNEMPMSPYKVTPHRNHAVIDILPLQSVGAKKVITCGLDSRCVINDVQSGQIITELQENSDAHALITSLSYSKEFALLATSSSFDPEPTLWTPLAGKFISKLRDIDSPHRGRIIGVHCIEQPDSSNLYLQPWHLLSADTMGMMKVWDIRKVMVLQTFWLDPVVGDVTARLVVQDKTLSASQDNNSTQHQSLTMFDYSVDSSRGWLLSAGRTGIERITTVHRQLIHRHKNGYVAHDTPISFVLFNEQTFQFLTISGCDVRIWDATTGSIISRFAELSESDITSVALDTNRRRFIIGCHNGSLQMHVFVTGGIAIMFSPAPSEIVSVAEIPNKNLIIALSENIIFHYSESSLTPITQIRQPSTTLCMSRCLYFDLLAVGDVNQSITIYDTASVMNRLEEVGCCKISHPNRDILHGEISEEEEIIRRYMNPPLQEISCIEFLKSVGILLSGDYSGHITAWTVKHQRCLYTECGRWKCTTSSSNKTQQVPAYMCHAEYEKVGKKTDCVFVGDDLGCISKYDLRPVITALKKRSTDSSEFHHLPQATIMCHNTVHTRRTAVSSLLIIPTLRLLVTSGTDCSVFILDYNLTKLGALEQGRMTSSISAAVQDYSLLSEMFTAGKNGDPLPEDSSELGIELDQQETSKKSEAEEAAPVFTTRMMSFPLNSSSSNMLVSLKSDFVSLSKQVNNNPITLISEHGEREWRPVATPLPSPARSRKLRNLFSTKIGRPNTAGEQFYSERREYVRKRETRDQKQIIAARETERKVFSPSPHLQELCKNIQDATDQLSIEECAVFRRQKATSFDPPCLTTALQSLPSSDQDWLSKVHQCTGVADWIVYEIDSFYSTPGDKIINAPRVCDWITLPISEESSKETPVETSPPPPPPPQEKSITRMNSPRRRPTVRELVIGHCLDPVCQLNSPTSSKVSCSMLLSAVDALITPNVVDSNNTNDISTTFRKAAAVQHGRESRRGSLRYTSESSSPQKQFSEVLKTFSDEDFSRSPLASPWHSNIQLKDSTCESIVISPSKPSTSIEWIWGKSCIPQPKESSVPRSGTLLEEIESVRPGIRTQHLSDVIMKPSMNSRKSVIAEFTSSEDFFQRSVPTDKCLDSKKSIIKDDHTLGSDNVKPSKIRNYEESYVDTSLYRPCGIKTNSEATKSLAETFLNSVNLLSEYDNKAEVNREDGISAVVPEPLGEVGLSSLSQQDRTQPTVTDYTALLNDATQEESSIGLDVLMNVPEEQHELKTIVRVVSNIQRSPTEIAVERMRKLTARQSAADRRRRDEFHPPPLSKLNPKYNKLLHKLRIPGSQILKLSTFPVKRSQRRESLEPMLARYVNPQQLQGIPPRVSTPSVFKKLAIQLELSGFMRQQQLAKMNSETVLEYRPVSAPVSDKPSPFIISRPGSAVK